MMRKHLLVAIAIVGVTAVASSTALAQAWLPGQGEGSVGIQWQNTFSRDHFFPLVRVDIGHIETNALIVDVTYGLTDRVAVDVSLPYIASKYNGPQPHPTKLDDGTFHGTMQDLRFAVRYGVAAGRFAFTPYIGTIVPSHDYQFYAHAAPGRGLRELQVGTYLAGLLSKPISGSFVQARIAYGFMESAADVHHGRAVMDLEIGNFVTERVRVFALGSAQVTNGGIDLPVMGPLGLPLATQPYHDQIDRNHYLNVGGGASFALRESIDLFGTYVTSVANRNGHAINRGIDIGINWSFKRRGASALSVARAAALTDRNSQSRSLVKCVCQR